MHIATLAIGFYERGPAMDKVKIEHHSVSGSLWFGGWLFTLGFLQLTFWKGLLAIVVWPYYLGVFAGTLGR